MHASSHQPSFSAKAAGVLISILFCAGTARAEFGINPNTLDEDNRRQYDAIVSKTAEHNFNWGAAWSPEPFTGALFGTAAWRGNLELKSLRPILQQPSDIANIPNTADGCGFTFDITNNVDEMYSDYLGAGPAFAPGTDRMPGRWGAFGNPIVGHGSTDVRVRTTLNGIPFGIGLGNQTFNQHLLSIGRHGVGYTAHTQINYLIDAVPWHLVWMRPSSHVAKVTGKGDILTSVGQNALTTLGPAALSKYGVTGFANDDAGPVAQRFQRFFVLDTTPPVFNSVQDTYTIEATDVGGRVLTPSLERQVRELTLTYSDRCREPEDLEVRLEDAPPFLEVEGDYVVTWRVLDCGPAALPSSSDTEPAYPGGRNEAVVQQTWQIRDTTPPLIKPPSGRVVETEDAIADVALGNPAVFDAADPLVVAEPTIDGVPVTSDTVSLASPSRTKITWTATDASENSSQRSQWLTLKPMTGPDSNTAPIALGNTPFPPTMSFEQVDIELLTQDNDFIDGRYDQLSFAIERPPKHGTFIAPLFPFFIEDYRIEASLSEEEGEIINPIELLERFRDWCADPVTRFEPLPRDLVREPEYVTVADDGTSFVRDVVTSCVTSSGDVRTESRIAQFNADEELVAEYVHESLGTVRSFWIGQDGFLYYKTPGEDVITKVDPTPIDDDPTRPPRMATTRMTLFPVNDVAGLNRSLRDIRSVATDKDDLLYITDGAAAYVFDMTRTQPNQGADSILFVGDLVPRSGFSLDATTNGEMDMTLDSKGNVYFADEELHRLWKVTASSLDRTEIEYVDGQLVGWAPGEIVGWAGRCTGNRTTTPACSVEDQRSFGFACTDELCEAGAGVRSAEDIDNCQLPGTQPTTSNAAGCAAGQFDQPKGIAINSLDILYVADFNNARIQRFDTSGMYGGQAVSNGDGTSFVLGDFGRPVDVAVNTDNFYVLDTENDIMHSFLTTPITNVEEAELNLVQNAFVTYQSNNGFVGTDSFTFTTSDGLATSETPATVVVNVERNFRPPEAIRGIRAETEEEVPADIELLGTDPDFDTLTYAVSTQASNGVVELDGHVARYVPNENFAGTDSFWFVVDDGATSVPAMTSEPAQVFVEVLPLQDDPTLEFEFTKKTTPAYDVPFSAYSYDPDVGDELNVTVEWGDGSVTAASRNTAAKLTLHDDDGFDVRVEGTHFYSNPNPPGSPYQLVVCVADDLDGGPLDDCSDPRAKTILRDSVVVEQLVDLIVDVADDLPKSSDPSCPTDLAAEGGCPQVSDAMVDGDTLTYTTTITNFRHGDDGLNAAGVEMYIDFPEELTPLDVTFSPADTAASVELTNSRIDVSIDEIPLDASVSVAVRAATPGNLFENRAVDILGYVSSDFEDPSGLNPVTAHTKIDLNPDGDADGDAVLNRDDAFPGDPTEHSDNDGDGIGDNGDLDDDNDSLPDTWERRYGLDSLNAGEAALDPDNDGLVNYEEFLANTHPDAADSDLDGEGDGNDNCPAHYNRNQYDADADSIGDVCDSDGVAEVAALGDLDGNGARDYALVRSNAGVITAYLKDSAENISTGASTIAMGSSDATALQGVVAFGELGLAGLFTDEGETHSLRSWDAMTGMETSSEAVFDQTWHVVGLQTLDTADRPQVVIAANNDRGQVGVERRFADDGALVRAATLLQDSIAVDIGTSKDGAAYGVLAVDLENNVLQLIAASSSDDTLLQSWTVTGNDWLQAYVTGTEGGFAVLTQSKVGDIDVIVFSLTSDLPQSSFSVYDNTWTALGLSAFDADTTNASALAIMVADEMGEARIGLVDSVDGTMMNEQSYHTASDSPRALIASAYSDQGDVGALASDATRNVTLELRSASGGDVQILTAEETTPTTAPPPPPPPPAPTGDNQRGGGAFDPVTALLLLLASQVVALRRRRVRADSALPRGN